MPPVALNLFKGVWGLALSLKPLDRLIIEIVPDPTTAGTGWIDVAIRAAGEIKNAEQAAEVVIQNGNLGGVYSKEQLAQRLGQNLPPSTTAIAELVVPRSIPNILLIYLI